MLCFEASPKGCTVLYSVRLGGGGDQGGQEAGRRQAHRAGREGRPAVPVGASGPVLQVGAHRRGAPPCQAHFKSPWKELSAEKKRSQLSSVVTKLLRFKVGHLILALLKIKIDLSISGPY